MVEEAAFTDVEGIRVGHAQDFDALTGCTVVLCEEGATGGVDVRGGAPGTRETDLLHPMNLVDKIHAVLLSGGSAFGLEAAAGVVQYLDERGKGFDALVAKVPLVCGAVLFDLGIGDPKVRPDKTMGYEACRDAAAGHWREGSIGAGTGATVGKAAGMNRAMKGGMGACCLRAGELLVGALVVVNCLGDVVDPATGRVVAGTLTEGGHAFADTEALLCAGGTAKVLPGSNTTLGVVATNWLCTKAQANRIAAMAHDGYARSMRPAHSMFDGDAVFCMATGRVPADTTVVGLLGARAVEHAVLRAVQSAASLGGIKSCEDLDRSAPSR